jgi:hypothetical protein
LSLDVHIRTTIRRDMSSSDWLSELVRMFLKSRARSVYWLNGVSNADLPNEFSIRLLATQPTDKQHVFGEVGATHQVKTYKDFVSVVIEQGRESTLR